MVPFLVQFSPFFGMVPFLFLLFSTCLEWYYFCRGGEIFIILWNGTILGSDFWYFSLLVPFLLPNFSQIPQLVPFL